MYLCVYLSLFSVEWTSGLFLWRLNPVNCSGNSHEPIISNWFSTMKFYLTVIKEVQKQVGTFSFLIQCILILTVRWNFKLETCIQDGCLPTFLPTSSPKTGHSTQHNFRCFMLTERIQWLIIQLPTVFNPLTSGCSNISWSSKYLHIKFEQWKVKKSAYNNGDSD